ncbi:PREDICTED: uncharacterized protein LOC108769827 [Trachymyrmex cornetzi]|uniref:uncharacterized protein LOC108769827 n=1 Tax=Trachymyrmex cornetzi TaxID=471704 RepID=UPI00084F2CC5|nr:PREDICTED: uncharacterized protein LOC108769827 [Trachymyrmex cornetzi]
MTISFKIKSSNHAYQTFTHKSRHRIIKRSTSHQLPSISGVASNLQEATPVEAFLPPTGIGAATYARIPPFWKENPALWFVQVEAAFSISRITYDDTKYRYVVLHLDNTALPFVSDIIANPPLIGRYQALKDRIIRSFDETGESKLRKLIRGNEIGDDKPSNFLQRLRNLAGGQCNDSVLRTLFFEQLPENVRSVLAISEVTDLSILASQADRIYEIIKPTINTIASANASQAVLSNQIDDLTKRIDALARELRGQRLRRRSHSRQSRKPSSRSGSSQRSRDGSSICWYHRQFDMKAKKCQQPCDYRTEKKSEN